MLGAFLQRSSTILSRRSKPKCKNRFRMCSNRRVMSPCGICDLQYAKLQMLLSKLSSRPTNNFDIIRLWAALVVLISHSFPLAGTSPVAWHRFFFGYEPTILAVGSFFVISGFLITGSVERRDMPAYATARLLRIIPALAVVSVLSALVLGPIVTTLSVSEYFQSKGTYEYLLNAIPYRTYFQLPGVFNDLPLATGVNGSLWTIPIEAFCYVFLALIFVGAGRRHFLIYMVTCIVAIIMTWHGVRGGFKPIVLFGTTELLPVLRYGLFFLIGSVCWSARRLIPINGYLALVATAVLLLAARTEYTWLALYVSLPYLLLYLAYVRPVFSSAVKKMGDLSYGTYLFAFPIQQSIVALSGQTISGWQLAMSATPIALMCAWASWKFIEKPALNLRRTTFRAPPLVVTAA